MGKENQPKAVFTNETYETDFQFSAALITCSEIYNHWTP